jgi:cell division protein FtsI (penicillin-binding protein 3)
LKRYICRELRPDVRRQVVLAAFALVATVLVLRGLHLKIVKGDFLIKEGNSRVLRTVKTHAYRGMILDRNKEPLAISTPTRSLELDAVALANAKDANEAMEKLPQLAKLLNLNLEKIRARVGPDAKTGARRRFISLKRHVSLEHARQVVELNIPGVSARPDYRRYYPASHLTAHVVGFTNIDDHGQEGVELLYEEKLRGVVGMKVVIKDRLNRTVEPIESLQITQQGVDLHLSLDKRLQFVAHRELKNAVQQHRAKGGTVVMLNAKTGEVLAMVAQPDFDPNDHRRTRIEQMRNRAVTDVFEPGSTMKPFTVAAALEAGTIRPSTSIDTRPGVIAVGHHFVRDDENLGRIDVSGVISKSSNVGISKIALGLPPETMWTMFDRVGLGAVSGAHLPGESAGRLEGFKHWDPFEQATISFGYGVSVTALQLAHAYTVFVNDGVMVPATLILPEQKAEGARVMSARTARQVRSMLEEVVLDGTGKAAALSGYRVGGKTGTAHKTNEQRHYAKDDYHSLFVGMLTASSTPIVTAIMIDDANDGLYFGGDVAAPVFSKIMQETVRLLNIPPDAPVGAPHHPTNMARAHANEFAETSNQ